MHIHTYIYTHTEVTSLKSLLDSAHSQPKPRQMGPGSEQLTCSNAFIHRSALSRETTAKRGLPAPPGPISSKQSLMARGALQWECHQDLLKFTSAKPILTLSLFREPASSMLLAHAPLKADFQSKRNENSMQVRLQRKLNKGDEIARAGMCPRWWPLGLRSNSVGSCLATPSLSRGRIPKETWTF